eukprot:Rhum_TRINITY_DN14262_c18_g1::Rhum_TRINITY_DN14262_c18_g1_i1::g.73819::m.73819
MEPPLHSSSGGADDVPPVVGLPPRPLVQSLSVPSHITDDTFALSPRSMASLSPPSLMRLAPTTAAARLQNEQASPYTEQDSTSFDLSPVARGRALQHYANSPDSLSPGGSGAWDSLSGGSPLPPRALWSPSVPAAARAAKLPVFLTSGGNNKSDARLSVSPESEARQPEDTATATVTVTPSVSQESVAGQTPALSNGARTSKESGSAADDDDD